MQLQQPLYLLLIPVILLAALWASRPRQWLNVPARRQAVPASFVSRLVLRVPLLCWLAVAVLLALSLVNPSTRTVIGHVAVEKKVLVVCMDASTSMGSGPTSTLEKARPMSLDFIRNRTGDFVGVTAYSGFSNPRRGRGYARVLMYPTDDLGQSVTAMQAVASQMFGTHTALGDGIFVSLLALIEPDARRVMGEGYDRWLLDASVDSLGTDHEDVSYAQRVAGAIGPQKGKFVLLFTDGTINTGMEQLKALWFARRLGIKVHLIAYNISGPTGLSRADEVRVKAELIRGVLAAGGIYRESADMDDIARYFREVNRLEGKGFVYVPFERVDSEVRWLYSAAALCFVLWVVAATLWKRVP